MERPEIYLAFPFILLQYIARRMQEITRLKEYSFTGANSDIPVIFNLVKRYPSSLVGVATILDLKRATLARDKLQENR